MALIAYAEHGHPCLMHVWGSRKLSPRHCTWLITSGFIPCGSAVYHTVDTSSYLLAVSQKTNMVHIDYNSWLK